MKGLFSRDSFDIAPQARRPTRASWVALAAGLLFASLCTWPLVMSVQALRQTAAAQNRASAATRTMEEGQRAAMRQNGPAAAERSRAQKKLQQTLRMSWSGLLEALETATHQVQGGVSILTLVPTKVQDEAAQVSITAMAANPAIMLKYIGSLQKDIRVRQVEISTQQPDDKVGPEVIRFQLSVLWDPTAQISPAMAADQAQGARAAIASH